MGYTHASKVGEIEGTTVRILNGIGITLIIIGGEYRIDRLAETYSCV